MIATAAEQDLGMNGKNEAKRSPKGGNQVIKKENWEGKGKQEVA